MIDPKLSEYIKKQHALGTSDETIRSILIKAGWQVDQVKQAFQELSPRPTPTPGHSAIPLFRIGFRQIVIILTAVIAILAAIIIINLKTADARTLSDAFHKFSLAKDFEANGQISLSIKDYDTFKRFSFADLRQEFINPETFDYGIIKGQFRSKLDTDSKDQPEDPSPVNNRRELISADIEIETHTKNNDIFQKQSYSFDLYNFNQSTYFRLTQYTGLESDRLETIRNQWLKFNPKIIRSILNIQTKADTNGTEVPVAGLLPETTNQIRQAFAQDPPFDLIEKSKDTQPLFENIHLKRYHLKFNEAKTKALTQSLITILSGNELAVSIIRLIDQYMSEFTNSALSVSLDTLTNLPYQATLTLNPGMSPNQSKIESAFLDLSLRNYRRVFPAAPPENFIDLEAPPITPEEITVSDTEESIEEAVATE